jgi:isoleucyl-tRNA synthetase
MSDEKKQNQNGAGEVPVPREGFDPAKLEQEILKFWEENRIFEKTLEKTKDGKPFTFYDGPPFATGLPHYGHILASTVKDLIPRYQTMRGRFVRRRWGWDCHGLPIEEIVERHLGISGKKQIEELGIGKFNAICREKVLEFADEWGKMVRRVARWVDFDHSYKTMDRDYMESVWWAFKQIYDKGLVYEGRKVLMYCPRCETPLSNFEVAMDNSYKDVEEETVTAKFKIKDSSPRRGEEDSHSDANQEGLSFKNTYLLAWTTTPWTLPGNVALAVGENIDYAKVKILRGEHAGETYVTAFNRLADTLKDSGVVSLGQRLDGDDVRATLEIGKISGRELVGLEYEPLFEVPAMKSEKSYKVYPADFVTTEDGTGIVHAAVVYGEDDYNLGIAVGLPVVPMLDSKGLFDEKAPEFLRGQYFKKADALIIKNLEERETGSLVFKKEKHMHSYPHCWRCGTALYYNAIPAWFVNVQKIKKGLLKSNNKTINWYPAHLKQGRYAKSVEQAPDWNISRNRYWGNPIPVWKCENAAEKNCPPIVVGSIKELGLSSNTFYFSRHGEARVNVIGINSCWPEKEVYDLTEAGVKHAENLAKTLKKKGGVDMVFASDLLRTKHTAEIVGKALGVPVVTDERLREYNLGIYNGKSAGSFNKDFPEADRWTQAPEGGENWKQIQDRMVSFIKETDKRYQNKKILVISHGDPLWLIQQYYGSEREYPTYADPFEVSVGIDDLHRPGIDDVVLKCPHCGGAARRIKEIFDSWTEAGSMPFAEYHYPFDNKEVFESRLPAQFVAEYVAQTRAWFYNMHIISQILFDEAPFENAVTTGNILAEDGSKMSKSKKNYPDPWVVIEKYGVDALRLYLMGSPVMAGDDMNFTVRDLEIGYRRVIMILLNVHNYYETYAAQADFKPKPGGLTDAGKNPLDQWIWARTQELVNEATAALDGYDTVRYVRGIENYVDDLSTWYLRRSRGRKDEKFFYTLRHALLVTSKIIAPVMPYLAEKIYRDLNLRAEVPSVHLADWPHFAEAASRGKPEEKILEEMKLIREAASAGLALRKAVNIPIRQPLAALKIKNQKWKLPEELLTILCDEVNVKDIVFDAKFANEFELDTAMTPELKLEGLVRGLERAVQELRKKNGLAVGETAELLWNTEEADMKQAIVLVNREKTYLKNVREDAVADEAVTVDGKQIKLTLRRI